MRARADKKKKILVIDDNDGILTAMKMALELEGYYVTTSDSFKGVDSVASVDPSLIFLDISLVGQDGREVAKILKASQKTEHIPIVILTAYPNAGELAKEANADDFLSKPFELTDLWQVAAKYAS